MQRDTLLLTEIIDTGERIVTLAANLDLSDPSSDRDRVDALLWNYTVMGEAAAQVSTETKEAHPEVPWADSVRLRNRIVHGYWSIDLDILVSTARDDIPGLLDAVRAIRGEGRGQGADGAGGG